MSCPTSKSRSLEKARRPSTYATRQMRMTFVLAFFLFVSTWPQMVSLAPTPQQNDAVTSSGQKDNGSLIDGRHDGSKSTHLEPPQIHLIDNVNFMFSSLQDDGIHSAGTMAPRNVEEDQPNLVFNIVIQKERTEKSAFIAPDVNWLRDLVPKVVDVVDKPETTIKDVIFDAMDAENGIEPIRDRQLFINVVKSQIGSENDVPQILHDLHNLMQTGGPEVESKLIESRDIGEPQALIYVINIIIFNIVVLTASVDKPVLITDKVSHIEDDITEDSYIVALKESQKNRFVSGSNKIPTENQQLSRTPEKGIEEDSYIVALKESQKHRNIGSSSPVIHHHHEEKHNPHAVDEGLKNQQQFNGHFFTEVPTYGYVSTARPLMAMEKNYLRRYTIKPAVDAVEEEEQLTSEPESSDGPQSSSPIADPFGSLEFVNLPTGPYFTHNNPVKIDNTDLTLSIEKPPEIEAVVVANAIEEISYQLQTTKKPDVNKPLIVRIPEAVGVMTNKAANVVRNRIRTVGMFGIPMVVGLASTVNSWLPVVTAFGRRRRRRSITDKLEENRAIGNGQILARLMGKDREQRSTEINKRPRWLQRLSSVKRPRTSKKMKDFLSTSRKFVTPLFYATFFANDKEDDQNVDVMEHRQESTEDDLEQDKYLENDDVEQPTDSDQPEKIEMEEETMPDEEVTVSPSINSNPGSDFDIVSNFVRAMMMNDENKDDPAENREEIFWVKGASIVNTTQTVTRKPNKPLRGSSLLLLKPGMRLPSSGISDSTVSVFPADPTNPNWINSENVTNSPITYVSIKSPTKVTWLGVGPPDMITSTQSSSAEYDDPVEVIDNIDLPPSEIVGAPLEFYSEESDNYVSKEVPLISVPVEPTIPSYYFERPPSITDEPPTQPLADPGSMPKPMRPMVFRPTDLRPGLSNLLLTIASFNRPRLPPSPVDVSSSTQGIVAPPDDEFRDEVTDKYTDGIVTPNDDTLKYTHGHGIIVTNPPSYDWNQLTAESSLQNQNALPNLVKVTTNESLMPSLMGETSMQFVGMYGGTTVNSTYGQFSTMGISDSEEMESTLDDLITQLKTNLTTGLVTDRPVGGLHFVNSSTEIVIMNPFVTEASSIFPQLQVEAVEAEQDDDENADNSIVVDAAEGNQPDTVPVVSNLANLFFPSSGSSSSSGSSVSSGGTSSGGISGGSVSSSSSTNPLASLYVLGLTAISIVALTLPIWIPFIVGKKKRRTYAPSKSYPASKKKTLSSVLPKKTYGEPPPDHYKDMSEEEIYGNDHYLDQLATTQYQTTTVDDLFRPSVEIGNSDYSISNSDDHYIFGDSIALNPQDDMFNNPGPLNSEDVYGPPARIFLKARRRRSLDRFKPSNKR